MDHPFTPLAEGSDELGLIRNALVGIVLGMLAFAVLTMLIMRVAASDWGWGAAVGIGAFGGLWAGIMFGSAAGIALFQHRKEHGHAVAGADAPATTATATGTTAATAH